MRSRFFAFTLIEILIVVAIILVLASLIVPKILPVQQKVLRASCARNVKSLLAAIHTYSALYVGQWKIKKGELANEAYGSLFQKEGWNDLSQLVCPANSVGKAPKPAGYGAPLDMVGATIDYWIVHAGNTTGNTSETTFLTPPMAPGNNVLLIEKFSGAGAWLSSDFHKEGGTVGRVNGSAEFLAVFQKNTNDQGETKSISKADCTYY
jgi:prepilin-type N-terminal cleavage/methylation domain-containing protein